MNAATGTDAPRSPLRRLLGLAVDVHDGELPAMAWSFLYFFFLLASYYVLRPLRDEMGIAGGVQRLPWLFTGTLLVMFLAVPLWSALAARLPVRRLIPIVYGFFLLNLLGFFAAFQVAGAQVWAARAFFIWTSVFNLFVVSIFWSLMADLFREGQGKRLFGFISAGGGAGAIAGPLLTALVVGQVGPIRLLLIAAGLLGIAALCAGRAIKHAAPRPADAKPSDLGLSHDGDRGVGGDAWAAVRLLVRSRLLTGIAVYVFLLTATGTLSYIVQARLIAGADLSPTTRTALFARLDFYANVGSALVQAFIAGRLIARFGVGTALGLLPVLTIGGWAAMAAAPGLAVLVIVNVLRRVLEYAVARPAREVLFTRLTREEKYKPKALIDMVVYRGGDTLSSWTFTSLFQQGVAIPTMAVAAIPLGAVWLAVSVWLGRKHERAT